MNSAKDYPTNNPLISVVMPAYNGEKHLREAIDSILGQTFKDFELIIVNDGSTDSTEEIILSYTDERVVYVKNEVNLRLIKTLNKGLDIAKGKYIARMDADDVSFPDRFEIQLNHFDQNPDVGIVNGRSLYLYPSGKIKTPISYFWRSAAAPYIQPFGNTISHPSVMVLAELLKTARYNDTEKALHIEDWELWLRLYSKGVKSITPDKALLHYRITDGSINRLHKGVQIDNMSTIAEGYLKGEFDFEIDREVLRYIMGDRGKLIKLKHLKQVFKNYITHIKKRFNVSDAVVADIELWVYDFCLRDLKHKLSLSKAAVLTEGAYFSTHFDHRNMARLLQKKKANG